MGWWVNVILGKSYCGSPFPFALFPNSAFCILFVPTTISIYYLSNLHGRSTRSRTAVLVPQPETAPFCHFVTFPPPGGITLGGSDDALCRHSLPPRTLRYPPLRVNLYLSKFMGWWVNIILGKSYCGSPLPLSLIPNSAFCILHYKFVPCPKNGTLAAGVARKCNKSPKILLFCAIYKTSLKRYN